MLDRVLHEASSFEVGGDGVPVVYVISDSMGDTAADVALAASSQFTSGTVQVIRLPNAGSIEQIERFLDSHQEVSQEMMVVFYTIADWDMAKELSDLLAKRGMTGLDLLGPAVRAIAKVTGEQPTKRVGAVRKTDERYFKRIEAMEFFVSHDDGRNTDSLDQADIVLIGVSRTSKTPLSMYLSLQGYKVANIPLAAGMNPPAELFDVDPSRLFGLLSTPQVLSEIRYKRLGTDEVREVAGSYAEPSEIQHELDEARRLMKKLGCIVIHTDGRAVEETAQEIRSYYESFEKNRK